MFRSFSQISLLGFVLTMTASAAHASSDCSALEEGFLAWDANINAAYEQDRSLDYQAIDKCRHEAGVWAFSLDDALYVECESDANCDVRITDNGSDVRVHRFDDDGRWNQVAKFPGLAAGLVEVLVEGTDHSDVIVADLELCAPLRIDSGGGDDLVRGSCGDDTVRGDAGNDVLIGSSGADHLIGEDGADLIIGGPGDDVLAGGFDNDVIRGGDGADRLNGDMGADFLLGGDGLDDINGGGASDLLAGGDGDDVLTDNATKDIFKGGAGADDLQLSMSDLEYVGSADSRSWVGPADCSNNGPCVYYSNRANSYRKTEIDALIDAVTVSCDAASFQLESAADVGFTMELDGATLRDHLWAEIVADSGVINAGNDSDMLLIEWGISGWSFYEN